MKIAIQVLIAMVVCFNVFAVEHSNQKWVDNVMKENAGISRVYFTSGEIMIALVTFSDTTSQFYEITQDEKVSTVFPVTARFSTSDLSKVVARTKYFISNSEHGRPRVQAGFNLTDVAITIGISTPVGFAAVPATVVLDVLTSPVQFTYWMGRNQRYWLENYYLKGKVEAQESYVELNDIQYNQVKWALGQAHPLAKIVSKQD